MTLKILNYTAVDELVTGVNDSATEIEILDAAPYFAITDAGNTCQIRIDDEIMLVTAADTETDVLTVTRGQDSTAAASHLAGADVQPVITASYLNGLPAANVAVADAGNIITAANAEAALAELAGRLDALSLTTAGNGASLVGVQDSDGLLAAANVEAALAELAALATVATATDPGDGQSIDLSAYMVPGKRISLPLQVADAESGGTADETRTLPNPTAEFVMLDIRCGFQTTFKITLTVSNFLAVNPSETGSSGVELSAQFHLLLISQKRSTGGFQWRALAEQGVTYPEAP